MIYGHNNEEAWELATYLDNTYWEVVDEAVEAYDEFDEQVQALFDELPDEINGIEITYEKLEEYLAE